MKSLYAETRPRTLYSRAGLHRPVCLPRGCVLHLCCEMLSSLMQTCWKMYCVWGLIASCTVAFIYSDATMGHGFWRKRGTGYIDCFGILDCYSSGNPKNCSCVCMLLCQRANIVYADFMDYMVPQTKPMTCPGRNLRSARQRLDIVEAISATSSPDLEAFSVPPRIHDSHL